MHLIDGLDTTPSAPAVAPVGPSPGWFREADVGSGTQGTQVTADWLNDIQGNFVHLFAQAFPPLAFTKGRVEDLTEALDRRYAVSPELVAFDAPDPDWFILKWEFPPFGTGKVLLVQATSNQLTLGAPGERSLTFPRAFDSASSYMTFATYISQPDASPPAPLWISAQTATDCFVTGDAFESFHFVAIGQGAA